MSAIKLTLTAEGLTDQGEYPAAVQVAAQVPSDLNIEHMEARLIDLCRSLLTAMTYSPRLVEGTFQMLPKG